MPDPDPTQDKWAITKRSLQDLIDGFGYDVKKLEREIDNRKNKIDQIMEHRDRLEQTLYKLEKQNE